MTILFGKRRILRKIGTVGPWFGDLKKQVERTLAGDVVFDISAAETINSEELSAITGVCLTLRGHYRQLILVNAQPQIEEVFEITRMNRLVQVAGHRQQEAGYQSALKIAGAAR